jgi:hypothetical protein
MSRLGKGVTVPVIRVERREELEIGGKTADRVTSNPTPSSTASKQYRNEPTGDGCDTDSNLLHSTSPLRHVLRRYR